MSDTPRTDAAIKASRGQWSFVLRDLCRELERELERELAGAYERFTDLEAEFADEVAKHGATIRRFRDELTAERSLADRLAALLQRDRDGYGGQVVDPACDCCDCEYLGPIDASLAAWSEARRQSDPDHDSRDETTYDELP
jgi:rubrerythrin